MVEAVEFFDLALFNIVKIEGVMSRESEAK